MAPSCPTSGPVTDRQVILRLAGVADATCLSALAMQVFLETYATSGIRLALAREAQSKFSAPAVLERLARRGTRTLLAECAGHLVAFAEVVLGENHALVPARPAAELTRLYVQSPFLRQGVGRQLLAKAEALASAEGASTLWLTAWAGNPRALAFYARQGYEQLGSAEYTFEDEAHENRLFAKSLRSET